MNFYVDRQFGCAIWLRVEQGIIKEFTGESEYFLAKLNEHYLGKPIQFFNDDFIGDKMKGTYHCLHSSDLNSALKVIQALDSKIGHARVFLTRYGINADQRMNVEASLKTLEGQRYTARLVFEKECGRVEKEHNFVNFYTIR